MVEAGAAVQQQQGRLLPHGGTVRHQLRALDVEEQPHPVDEYPHGQISLRTSLVANRRIDPAGQAA